MSVRSANQQHGRATLPVVAAATTVVLAAFTTTISTVADSVATYGGSPAGQTWILSGMSLGLAAALLSSGALADLFGHRTVFGAASGALAAASVLGAVAPSLEVLVVARVLQGAAGAGVLAAGLGLLGDAFPGGAERTRATALWGAALSAGIAIGPVLAAVLAQAASWRLAYWACAAAALGVALGARVLAAPRERDTAARLDLPGALSAAVAMGALTGGIAEGRTDWTAPLTLSLLGVGLAGLVVFALIERSRRAPMLDLSLLAHPPFLASVSGAAVTGLGTIAIMSLVPSFVHQGLGLTLLAGGAVVGVWSGTSVAVSTQVRRLPERLGAQSRLAAGLLGSGVGCGALALAGLASHWWLLLPGLFVAGAASGVVNAALARLAVESVPAGDAGLGSGANNTARYLGSALGIALVVVILDGGTGPDALGPWSQAAAYAGLVNVAGAVLVLALRSARVTAPPATDRA